MRNPATVALGLGLVGAVVATVLGLLTFGAQATVAPDHLPLAVAAPDDPALRQAANQVASHGGDAVDWTVTDPAHARDLLDDKDVYGILEIGRGPAITIVTSGAVNPQGTQVAQQVLTGAAQGLLGALAQPQPTIEVAPPKMATVHPVTTAGRTAPLAASALLWIAGLVGAMAFALLVVQRGRRPTTTARLTLVVSVSVLATGVVIGLLKLWDSSIPVSTEVVGFLLLTGVAFAAVQGALLRLLHLRAAAILGPMYLLAPAAAGTVPEMLDPAYRTLLWSWTPFRFSTEGLRSLLQGVSDAPDVRDGVLVLASMAVVGLVVLLWPVRGRPAAAPTEARELVGTTSAATPFSSGS
ncbi:ABC transporter permease [Actinophytocola sp.]|uniref:ABC transporter permease n=1 Tax=Actinophytocola sp. TaxID=1872138 RepID=UPI002D713152|nr:ABC transporter permease [Actinophytocola sp.]HYQ62388.1 ABC transporter permease [Actinophytocola sp.]